ncbi:MAG TPA: TIGR03619 family F420-dependent LLM class oxidoreductase, partial [Iamia sp.]|nr:TIGR03619 family F420-dependent LLM class oxidoreductase [Iamia sp.]
PYAVSGDMPIGNASDLPEPLTWLAFAAARTSTILLGTSCVILPERNPLHLAKQAATLDLLSGGRLRLGVGLGWCREEAEAAGTTWADRAPRAEAAIEAMRRLWTGAPVAYEGAGVAFPPVTCRPTPAGPDGIPIVICGPSVHAARRAGRIGDGFFTNHRDPDVLRGLIDAVHRAAEETGRDPAAIEITAGASPSPRTVERLEAMGVDRIIWPVPTRSPARVERQLTRAIANVT